MATTATPEALQEALQRLQSLIRSAAEHNNREPGAAALATGDGSGRLSVRTIYANSFEDDGIAFLCSLHSGKAQQLRQNPRAALCYFWPELSQQVSVEGGVRPLDESVADRLWQRRLRDEQMGTWVSEELRQGDAAAVPRERLPEVRSRFRQQAVPRPESWHAFLLQPDYLRFWSTGWHRVARPVLYQLGDDGRWQVRRTPP